MLMMHGHTNLKSAPKFTKITNRSKNVVDKPKLLTASTTRNDPDENRSLVRILNQFKLPKSLHFFTAHQPPVGQSLLIHEVSRSHTTTHTVGRTPLDE